ncbi:MAG TPA: hypothetical protein EYH30_10900 [Anaerolineales bacterium]|nr:hypothetical protein [Anaerolineae bacterium]HIQ02604.1 hypothetical protein [Anaerolineales bacterium]
MPTLHVVSHTHWDREWYLTFQQFRFRLTRLVEALLEILGSDPGYRHFTLDGQAAVLEDVVDVRPDLEEPLRRHVREGRILIGPWFVLPDEFLVSPEALVRNLLLGDRICRAWGAKMDVGYLPDPFGHISQLPQLLRGFGIETAVFARGAGDMPVEFRWAAPDGTPVLVCYLRGHYDNAAYLPADEEGAARALAEARDSLVPHTRVSHLLLMQGADHMYPRPDLPRLLSAADVLLPDRVLHSTLPAYVAAVRAELGEDGLERLPLLAGEMRDPSRAPILPGVLSTRMWIKQRNHACQTLLERWAEPFGALAEGVVRGCGDTATRRRGDAVTSSASSYIRRAWRYLLENHPHDSICGCSVDQVHREMATRFDWCEQLGEEVARAALETLAAQVDTGEGDLPALVVFNPSSSPRTDRVIARVTPPVDPAEVMLLSPEGTPVPFRVLRHTFRSEMEMQFDRETMAQMVAQTAASGGVVWGEWRIAGLQTRVADGVGQVAVTVTRNPIPTGPLPLEPTRQLQALLEEGAVSQYRVRIREEEALEVAFVARDVPPLGYTGYRFLPSVPPSPSPRGLRTLNFELRTSNSEPAIENEFLRVEADPQTGLLTVLDKGTGWSLPDCHRFVDGGDRGDEYNYCRLEQDLLVDSPVEPPTVRREADGVGQSLVLQMTYRVPEGLDPADRSGRSAETVELPIAVRVTLTPGVRRVDFETTVDNRARDHRLRVHFPVPLAVGRACAEGHWDVVEWPPDLPADTEGGAEQPVPTRPQRGWTSISDGARGVTLANRGLPEVEVLQGRAGVEIALTLLRCVGWLSRDDLPCRPGHAGPGLPVEEAQCPGRHTFRYALIPHAGDWRMALVEATAFQTDLRAIPTSAHPGPLPPSLSFIRVEPEMLQVSAVKPPEEGEGLILRLWNADDRPVEGSIRLWRPFARAVQIDLAEREGDPLAHNADRVALTIRGREVVTLRFYYS